MADEQPRWTRRPDGSNWGEFGTEDEIGRLNLVTAERRLSAVSEVREGLAFCLSLPLDYPGGRILNPRRGPPVLSAVTRSGRPAMNYPLRLDDPLSTDILSDDCACLTLQYSTQWDGLSHFGQMFDADGDGQPEDLYYNGFRAGIDIIGPVAYRRNEAFQCDDPQGARRLGIDRMAETCVQGRGVMIDLLAHCGEVDEAVGYERLMEIMAKDNVVVETGDFVCFRTGFSSMLLAMERSPDPEALFARSAALDGSDPRLLEWISNSGVSALIADNFAVEGLSHAVRTSGRADGRAQPGPTLPLHAHCLFKLGVYLGELWHLGELADWLRAGKRSRFLLTAPPLRLPGAVGSPVSPVATV